MSFFRKQEALSFEAKQWLTFLGLNSYHNWYIDSQYDESYAHQRINADDAIDLLNDMNKKNFYKKTDFYFHRDLIYRNRERKIIISAVYKPEDIFEPYVKGKIHFNIYYTGADGNLEFIPGSFKYSPKEIEPGKAQKELSILQQSFSFPPLLYFQMYLILGMKPDSEVLKGKVLASSSFEEGRDEINACLHFYRAVKRLLNKNLVTEIDSLELEKNLFTALEEKWKESIGNKFC